METLNTRGNRSPLVGGRPAPSVLLVGRKHNGHPQTSWQLSGWRRSLPSPPESVPAQEHRFQMVLDGILYSKTPSETSSLGRRPRRRNPLGSYASFCNEKESKQMHHLSLLCSSLLNICVDNVSAACDDWMNQHYSDSGHTVWFLILFPIICTFLCNDGTI